MKTNNLISSIAALILILLVVYTCNHNININHNFRKTYTNINTVIHEDSTNLSFFKVHLKNGDVSIFDRWELSDDKNSIIGQGKLFDFNRNQITDGDLSVSIANIAIIETNQLESIRSKDKDKITALSILTGANVALDIFCATNPKACFGSCPTFYIEEVTLLHGASAEGFSSSIAPSLEEYDLDALQYSTSSSSISLTMKNEALETHAINELVVDAIPKLNHERAYHDKNGNYYICGKPLNAEKAQVNGSNIQPEISSIDEIEYFSQTDSTNLSSKEELIIEFPYQVNKNLGLLINFRQTLLTTYLVYSGISFMGDEVADYFTKIETDNSIRKRVKNPFKKLGGIKIYIWNTKENKWQFIEQLYETGPIAKNLMIVPFANESENEVPLKIKVEMSKGLWRLDYLGLTSIDDTVEPVSIKPNKIEIVNGADYDVEIVHNDDNNYLVSLPGNEFKFEFELPKLARGNDYELFLWSKGYYLEWVRQDWLVDKNLAKLKKMLMNDKQTWKSLAEEFKIIEHEMETVFWNSKYKEIN